MNVLEKLEEAIGIIIKTTGILARLVEKIADGLDLELQEYEQLKLIQMAGDCIKGEDDGFFI